MDKSVVKKFEDAHPELITQDHIYMAEFDDEEHSASMEYSDQKDQDLLKKFIEEQCKEYLAKNAQQIIDLAISCYIMDKKNRKLERTSFDLVRTKKNKIDVKVNK